MVYENFLETIQSEIRRKLEPEQQVTLQRIRKNNGVLLDGLSISSPGLSYSPTIYLNSYYEQVESGIPLSVIVEHLLLIYRNQPILPSDLENELVCFEQIQHKIVFNLVGRADNELLLSEVPNYPFLDLTVVFYVLLSDSSDTAMTVLVHNEHLKLWNVTKEELLSLAEINTPRLLPPSIHPIEDVIHDTILQMEQVDLSASDIMPINLYVLTNQTGINGAACLLYKDLLKNFAEQEKDDLLILPSSIHEVLLSPKKKALSLDALNEMVHIINQSEVPLEDQLSDHIYYFSREQDCIIIPFNSSEVNETGNLQ